MCENIASNNNVARILGIRHGTYAATTFYPELAGVWALGAVELILLLLLPLTTQHL
jgi:hypothetical protein